MPGLIMFNRRWTIGSDDFVFPSIGEIGLRLSWVLPVLCSAMLNMELAATLLWGVMRLIVLIAIYASHSHDFECPHGDNLKSFYLGTLVINTVNMVNTLALMCGSMQGTIKNSGSRRKNVPVFLYIKILLLLPECVWVILSSYWLFGHSYTCDTTVVWTARGAVITSWAIGIIMFVIFLAIFDPLGALDDRKSVHLSMNSTGGEQVMIASVSANKVWEARCRLLCCCIAGKQDTQQGFSEVARLVAEFFHDLDLVPTDLVAGLILVQKTQVDSDAQLSAIIQGTRQDTGSVNGESLANNSVEPTEWMTISNMAHYMKYAMGSYGWPFFMYEYLATGLCRLCNMCRCCACVRKGNDVFLDNCCQCNTAAIKKLSGVESSDLIYVTFHNRFKEIPFYVAVDKLKNTVVISIRGTLSLRDALADVSAVGAVLEIPGVDNSYCHEAMLDCAKYIKGKVEELGLIERALTHLQGNAGLVITGHSLGAGVASILAVLMKPQYPELMCFAFSPPGGLMSPSASRHTQTFICSVVVGKDLVPRLGMYTLLDLKVKILRALIQCNKPKYQILASGCFRLVCCRGSQGNENERGLSRDNLLPRYTQDQCCVLEDALKLSESKVEEILNTEWPLHPAGQILHIIDINEDQGSCGGDPQYCAVWSSPEYFDKIVISHRMVSDHFPNAVNDALEQLKKRNYRPSARRASQYLRQCSA